MILDEWLGAQLAERGALDTAHRAHQNCSQVFRYAIATGRAERDPAADLRGALPPPAGGHFASITEPSKIGALLRAIGGYEGTFVARCALRLAPLVFVRPRELHMAERAEFNLDDAEWRIPPERMKARVQHIVPLSTQAISILRDLHPFSGSGRFLFPSVRTRRVQCPTTPSTQACDVWDIRRTIRPRMVSEVWRARCSRSRDGIVMRLSARSRTGNATRFARRITTLNIYLSGGR